MDFDRFSQSLENPEPPAAISAPLAALWWDAKGDWVKAHAHVDEHDTKDGMAVHAYLHRKEGTTSNAEYWYRLAGREYHRATLEAEWNALVDALLVDAL